MFRKLMVLAIVSFSTLSVCESYAEPAKTTTQINIAYVRVTDKPVSQPLLMKKVPESIGSDGAWLGVADSNTTGKFLSQHYNLTVFQAPAIEQLQNELLASSDDFSALLVDVRAEELQQLLEVLPAEKKKLVINVGSTDDALRSTSCTTGLLHTIPSRAMLTDALAQYLILRQWRKWLLVAGKNIDDLAYKAAFERAAKRFGGKWEGTKTWSFNTDLRRTAQQEVPLFTQAGNYDAVIVADEDNQFGYYLPYSTWLPRPVVGTHGLVATGWHWSIEQWGAVQIQNRFYAKTNRPMQQKDFAAWLGVRAVAEAVTRTKALDAASLYNYMLSDAFELAAFKGRKLSFRTWNGQLRQPVALVHPQGLVSQSPQQGFLHPTSELDTLGFDQPEVSCKFAVTAGVKS